MEAQFRVLRVDADAAAEFADLTDLWSGQSFEEIAMPGTAGAARLLLGRVAPMGRNGGVLLPGWRSLADDGLADTLAGDLARVRAEQPRARLSQRECELLLAPHFDALVTAASDGPAEHQQRMRRLEEYLSAAPSWSLERAIGVLEDGGPQELLDRVAFESTLALDPLRNLLAEWTAAQARTVEAIPSFHEEESLEPETIEQALDVYDRARAEGASLNQAWKDLQKALQLLDAESPDGIDPWSEELEDEPIGPAKLPGLAFWIEAWDWERKHTERPASASERAAAAAFADFAEQLHEGELDASEISARDLWSFYASARSSAELNQRLLDLSDLIGWLRHEQGAFVMDDPSDWTEADRARLRASVELNARLRQEARPLAVTTRVAAVDPARVAAEEGDWVEVSGLPPKLGVPMRRGDLVAGSWSAGKFHAAAWFPQPIATAESTTEA